MIILKTKVNCDIGILGKILKLLNTKLLTQRFFVFYIESRFKLNKEGKVNE